MPAHPEGTAAPGTPGAPASAASAASPGDPGAGHGHGPGSGTGRPLDHIGRIQAEWARERPEIDVSPQGVIGRLHRVAGLLTEQLCVVYRRFGLSEGEFDVLAALRRAGAPYERAPGELAAHTMVTTGAMTKRIDRLERGGLVTRRRASDDGRGRVVGLTPAGRELIDQAFAEHMRNERRLLDALPPRDAARLEALLTSWLGEIEPPRDA